MVEGTDVAENAARTSVAVSPGTARQGEIYFAGMLHGRSPVVPAAPIELEERARAAMTPEAFAYVAGSAGRESTAAENVAAFGRRRIVPRMLRDVSKRDLSVTLLGRKRSHPLLVAPVGVQEIVHPDGDLATARACASANVPMIISNQASHAMEAIAAQMGTASRWFQLYWSKVDELSASFVRRAQACGCEAIVVTLDTTLLGWRPRDLDYGYLPFLNGKGIAQYTSDPVFRSLLRVPPEDDVRAASLQFMALYSNPALVWEKLRYLREHTTLPILLKGINHPEDAELAIEFGMDGIVVSNHGGRQVDGALAALDALERVSRAVAGRVPILFDSGIRAGADIFKALALGATAVLIGRPYVYGLAVAGEDGVRAVLNNLLADFDLTMGLAGCSTISEMTTDTLVGT